MQDENKTMKIVAVVLFIIALVLAGIFAFLLVSKQQQANARVAVNLGFQMTDYDAQTGSGIPVRVNGTNLKGEPVSDMILVEQDTPSIELQRGTYQLEIAGSPVSGQGATYSIPARPYEMRIEGDEVIVDGEAIAIDREAGNSVNFPVIDLVAIEADQVTDSQIASIRAWMQEFELPEERINQFVNLVNEAKANETKRKEAAALEAWRSHMTGQYAGTGLVASDNMHISISIDGNKMTVRGNLCTRTGSVYNRLSGNEWHFMLTDSTIYGYYADGDVYLTKDEFCNMMLPTNFPMMNITTKDGYVTELFGTS